MSVLPVCHDQRLSTQGVDRIFAYMTSVQRNRVRDKDKAGRAHPFSDHSVSPAGVVSVAICDV